MNILEAVKEWVGKLTEVGLLLVGIGIVLQILFGAGVDFITGDVIANLVNVIRSIGENGVFGLIALAVIVWIFHRRRLA
jgi:hypothetical protein